MVTVNREAYLDLLGKKSSKHHNKPEAQIQLSIIKYLRAKGFACGKTKTVGARIGNKFIFDPYTFRGFPDLVAFIPELIFIEVKAKSQQSDNQKWFQELCQKAGVKYILAYSLEDVRNIV